LIEVTILFGNFINRALELVNILASVSVISKDVFFFDFDGASGLLGLPLTIG